MSNAGQQLLEFQCPKCTKKLKANRQVAGKRVKCPHCGQTVKVPGGDSQAAVGNDDWLSLDIPKDAPPPAKSTATSNAITKAETKSRQAPLTAQVPNALAQKDLAGNSNSPEQVPEQRASPRAARPQSAKSIATSSTQSDGTQARKTPVDRPHPPAQHNTGEKTAEPSARENAPRRSVFDDELPELSSLRQSPINSDSAFTELVSLNGLDQLLTNSNSSTSESLENLGSLDDLASIPLVSSVIEAQAQYRIACKNCDTPQYVTVLQKGQTIQCPDCFIKFVVPGPPPNWKASKAASADDWGKGVEVRLAPVEALGAQQEAERERLRASDILRKAQLELDNEIDEMVGTDFDTKGFLEKSIGFLMDPTTVMQLVLYGCLFALMFGTAQFCVQRMQDGDRGFGLILFIAVPIFAGLVCLPMLSGGMALLESVANGRRRVAEWPSFNLFDNLSEILLIGAALGSAMLLGLIAGGLIGRVVGSNWLILIGILGTTFLLFPVLLLSMLDNGSMFQPVSTQVVRSITGSAEAWGAYYVKTLFGFCCVLVAWFLLLGRNPIAAAVSGFLLPWLLFFTCQQIGALAQGIAEFLSIEFASEDEQD